MARSNVNSQARVLFLVVLTVALCFGLSCEKAPEAPPAPANPTTTETSQTPDTPQAVEPTQEMAQPAEPTTPTTEAVPGPEMAPIDIELPNPMFVGTPTNINVPNLKKPLGRKRPPFLAPVGTKQLALNKPVSSSDEAPIIGEVSYVTDGDKEAADGSYVELGPMKQHVTIDLEQQAEIYAIVLWHYHKQPRVYSDVIVQISDDPDFVEGVTTVFNNDIDNSYGLGIGDDMHYVETSEGELIDCFSQGSPKGRYVRSYSNGNNSNDLNHYIEVDVYGKPVE
ncbi:MAG: hypothetical protein JW993_04560 [Sedimentisphaerales bacterium]|nr:hypothetical protein [Sedimentisphaerales bacterium]